MRAVGSDSITKFDCLRLYQFTAHWFCYVGYPNSMIFEENRPKKVSHIYGRAVTMWNADPRQQWDFAFLKKRGGGSPLPLNKGVLDACDLGPHTKAEIVAKIDPKCRRVLDQKMWFEWTAIISLFVCVTWRSEPMFACFKNVWQRILDTVVEHIFQDTNGKTEKESSVLEI